MDENTTEDAGSTEETVTPICHNDYCLSDQDYIAMVEEHIQPTSGEWILVAVFVLLFIVGLIGNFLVCYAVIKNSQMRTVTNLFIMNLAIADLMVISICLPPTLLVDVSETWFFGEVMCKIFLYFQTVSVAVSVLTLSAISIERWYAICHPLSFKSTPSRARNIIFSIWVFSASVAIPDLITAQLHHTLPAYYNDVQLLLSCRPGWPGRSQFIYQMFLLIGLYFLPFCLMAFTYTMIALVLWREEIPGVNETSRGSPNPHPLLNLKAQPTSLVQRFRRATEYEENHLKICERHRTMLDNRTPNTEVQLQTRRKAAKMLITVVVVFGICNLPVHILNIIRYSKVLDSMNAIPIFSLISRLLCYFNSAVNPIIYNFMSAKFRKEFKAVCMCCVPRLKRGPKHHHPKWGESYNFSYSRTNCQTEQFTLTSVKD